jgi:hypothetical protein
MKTFNRFINESDDNLSKIYDLLEHGRTQLGLALVNTLTDDQDKINCILYVIKKGLISHIFEDSPLVYDGRKKAKLKSPHPDNILDIRYTDISEKSCGVIITLVDKSPLDIELTFYLSIEYDYHYPTIHNEPDNDMSAVVNTLAKTCKLIFIRESYSIDLSFMNIDSDSGEITYPSYRLNDSDFIENWNVVPQIGNTKMDLISYYFTLDMVDNWYSNSNVSNLVILTEIYRNLIEKNYYEL